MSESGLHWQHERPNSNDGIVKAKQTETRNFRQENGEGNGPAGKVERHSVRIIQQQAVTRHVTFLGRCWGRWQGLS